MLLNSSKKIICIGRKQVRNQYLDKGLKKLGLSPIMYFNKFPCKLSREIYILLSKEFNLDLVSSQIIDKSPELTERYEEILKEIFGRQLSVKEDRTNNDVVLIRISENFKVIIGNHGSAFYKKHKDLWELICFRKQDLSLDDIVVSDSSSLKGIGNCVQYFPDDIVYINDMVVKRNICDYNRINFSLV